MSHTFKGFRTDTGFITVRWLIALAILRSGHPVTLDDFRQRQQSVFKLYVMQELDVQATCSLIDTMQLRGLVKKDGDGPGKGGSGRRDRRTVQITQHGLFVYESVVAAVGFAGRLAALPEQP